MTVTLYYIGVCLSGDSGCECGGELGFFDISTAEFVVESFTLHSYNKAKSEKHIHNMTTIFYLYDCIAFNDLP